MHDARIAPGRETVDGFDAPAPLSPPSLRRPYEVDVLLVEDDAAVRACLAEILNEGGLRVAEAANAAEALAIAGAGGFAAVLVTDLYLGAGMDGAALITALRGQRRAMGAVLISGAPTADDRLDPRDMFLAKPFHGDDLVQAVQTLRDKASLLALDDGSVGGGRCAALRV